MAERLAPPTPAPLAPAPGAPGAPASPSARRLRPSTWLDVRLVVGVLLVLVSVVLGARIVGAADTSVRVWAVSGDLAAGTTLTAADIRPVRVRLFTDTDRYLRTTSSPTGRTVTRPLGDGELLPRSALTTQPAGRLVSIPVAALHAPDSLARGQLVDVFATTKAAGDASPARTVRVLEGVAVQAVRAPRGGLTGSTTDYAVLLRVPPEDVAAVIAAVRTADIDISIVTGGTSPR